MRWVITRPSPAILNGRTGYKMKPPGSNERLVIARLVVESILMAEEKIGDAQSFLRMAKDVFRSFAYGGTPKGAKRPRVGVALAGGFARGIAHIGVLRVLREANIPVDVVSGTSVGAIIATAYCAGAPLESMERVAHETKFTDFGRWTPSWLGLSTNNRI